LHGVVVSNNEIKIQLLGTAPGKDPDIRVICVPNCNFKTAD